MQSQLICLVKETKKTKPKQTPNKNQQPQLCNLDQVQIFFIAKLQVVHLHPHDYWSLATLWLTDELSQSVSGYKHTCLVRQAVGLSKYHCNVNKAHGRTVFKNSKVLCGCADWAMSLNTTLVLFTCLSGWSYLSHGNRLLAPVGESLKLVPFSVCNAYVAQNEMQSKRCLC